MLGQKTTGVSEDQPSSDGEEDRSEKMADQEQNEDKGDDDIPENERIKMNLKNSSKIYYSITHTVQEEIKEQPKMIKGGTLKSY